MLRFYNSLTDRIEQFIPLNENSVGMYICGPTVWNFAHIGNFRTFVFGDILRRYLKFKGYRLTHVMNLTDVDDRIITESKKRGITIYEMTAPYIEAFWEDMDALGCERPDVAPRATEHINEMVNLIQKLLEKGRAYQSKGSVYYRIAAFPEYGKLSKINLEGNITGASGRVDADKYDKENVRDFALWKHVPEGEEPAWNAPFGRGRPGWHIECSAMSMKYLGESFDIHAGGIDLQFPHHENEIAQSEGATEKPFVKYWLHSEFLKVDGEKMAKSLGNEFTLRDIMARGFPPIAIRYLLLSVPYRKQLNFTFEGLKGAVSTVERLKIFHSVIRETKAESGSNPELKKKIETALKEFEQAMDDDLNTSVALAAIHNMVREVNIAISNEVLREDEKKLTIEAVEKFDSVLGIFGKEDKQILDEEIKRLIIERQEARKHRDYAKADQIRTYLMEKGIILEDTKEGVRWRRR
ncbi:MAG: cysteine--tRNA ligase [Pyrinomonadaceae bacterium]|nr:cysteine--tRNA ligase [Pyrinomonadaceae bacterium]MCX7639197.1 cysteine--tRNA ligase [Pyrinomonadaceae bacterium]MDW8303581.1 cysteine--tRNA ligase [Acidobacteriota bacterium]